jgi:putative ABC transport system ATP-binding protein
VLLADEPTGALDSATSFEILEVLQEVQAEGVTVIVITHERDIAAMTDRIVHLVDGEVAWDRRIERQDPAVLAAADEAAAPALAPARG